MRILILNWKHPGDPDAGGAERYVEHVADLWARGGHDVTLFVPRPHKDQASEAPHVRYIRRGSRHMVFAHARRHLQRHGTEYDRVIDSVSTRPFRAHDIVGSRAIALYHQIADEVWLNEFPRPLALIGRHVLEPRWLRSMRSARVVAVSTSTAAALARRRVACEAVVPPGCVLPPPALRDHPHHRPRLVFIGRLVRTKLPQDAVAAFRILQQDMPTATLDVIGDGYLRNAIAAGAGDGVMVHGHTDEATKHALLARADLLLFPATREGWGIVAMEAAAHGVPTVGYDVPGVRDVIVDGHSGVLTAPNPAALAVAAQRLLGHGSAWRRMARHARLRAERHTWQHTADSLELVVRTEVLRSGHSSVPAAGTSETSPA